MTNETFEQKLRLAKAHAESEGDNGNAEISFIAGYDACREQMRPGLAEIEKNISGLQANMARLNTLLDETSSSRDKLHFELEELKHALANTRLNEEWPIMMQLQTERAKSQKLLEILKMVTPYAANYNLLKHAFESDAVISAREIIKEYSKS